MLSDITFCHALLRVSVQLARMHEYGNDTVEIPKRNSVY